MAEAVKTKKERLNLRFPFVQKGMRYGEVDVPFFLTVLALLVMGIIMMFSASYAWAIAEGLGGTYYAQRQIIMGAIGLVLMFILSVVDYRIFRTPAIAIGSYVVSLILLVMVLIVGKSVNGAQRWLGTESFSFQPSELMKISLVIFFSYLIEMNYNQMNKFRTGVLPYIVALGLVAILLMLEPHLSCTILIGLIGITLIWVGGANLKHFLILIGAGILAVIAIVLYLSLVEGYDYIQTRIQSWRDPFSDSQGGTWQTCQSLIAIGSGGLFGLGLGESRQKFLYLPETKNDFVFSIVCEELGFAGALTVVLLFAFLVFRGYRIAANAPDKFGMLLAVGFTTHIGLQAFLNIAVVSNLVPNTGISLPFFSYGGTALILQLAEMGVVMNISRTRYKVTYQRTARRKKTEETETE